MLNSMPAWLRWIFVLPSAALAAVAMILIYEVLYLFDKNVPWLLGGGDWLDLFS